MSDISSETNSSIYSIIAITSRLYHKKEKKKIEFGKLNISRVKEVYKKHDLQLFFLWTANVSKHLLIVFSAAAFIV